MLLKKRRQFSKEKRKREEKRVRGNVPSIEGKKRPHAVGPLLFRPRYRRRRPYLRWRQKAAALNPLLARVSLPVIPIIIRRVARRREDAIGRGSRCRERPLTAPRQSFLVFHGFFFFFVSSFLSFLLLLLFL